ncbi:hypothetical protein MTo_03972 [Microcystis aeruginosa NIES-1211]|jgi:hypothetical protein|nr:hypothetical protein MTo_03972 [Microcystis aeruginosa NIES-1211]
MSRNPESFYQELSKKKGKLPNKLCIFVVKYFQIYLDFPNSGAVLTSNLVAPAA